MCLLGNYKKRCSDSGIQILFDFMMWLAKWCKCIEASSTDSYDCFTHKIRCECGCSIGGLIESPNFVFVCRCTFYFFCADCLLLLHVTSCVDRWNLILVLRSKFASCENWIVWNYLFLCKMVRFESGCGGKTFTTLNVYEHIFNWLLTTTSNDLDFRIDVTNYYLTKRHDGRWNSYQCFDWQLIEIDKL